MKTIAILVVLAVALIAGCSSETDTTWTNYDDAADAGVESMDDAGPDVAVATDQKDGAP